MNKKTMKKVKRQNLTLIEVLIVLAIVVVLFLLMAALDHARESARKVSCTNNLKCLGLSMRMYSNVYEEVFPDKNGRAGLQMLARNGFLENTQVYVCPSTKDVIEDTTKIFSNASYCYAGGFTEADCVDSAITSDRSMNHYNYGNIGYVDGHIKGYSGANWNKNWNGTNFIEF